MFQLRKLVLRGSGVEDATETFESGGNILAGESETGKSYLLHCIDYIFGADELKKRIPEAKPYSDLFVELENSSGNFLTLKRGLAGGRISVYRCKFEDAGVKPDEVVTSKRGKSTRIKDVSSVLFLFSGIPEAVLRKNDSGAIQRLSMRMFLPLLLVDEIAIIDERSPALGKSGFSETAHKRTLSFMLSGKDDSGIITSEEKILVKTRSSAQLSVITELLEPLENRAAKRDFSAGHKPLMQSKKKSVESVADFPQSRRSEQISILSESRLPRI